MDDEFEQRLGALGSRPVDAAVAEAHHLAMRGVAPSPPRRFQFGWRAVAAAAFVGFLAGSTGLAAAGTLPDPAQDLAHDVLARVGVNVPRSTEGCPEGRTYRNHGEYVAEVEAAGGDVEAAAHSDCGKPANRGHGVGVGSGGQPGVPREDTDGDPCTGPPPWAGAHLPADQRALLQEQRRAQCGDTEETEETDEADEVEEREAESSTTTTTPAETTPTTTTAETTTTVEATTTTETTTTTTG
jgi:hypothetical protein